MTGTPSGDPPADDAPDEPMTADRIALIRQRLADGYYRQPEVLERIAAAVRRALGRAD
ncbi:MAG TPA: hypothetical protein VJQ46_10080 [Gemmatimonadales bacterium]|nr:hypothetical protein [Gemmatimonadales bacterium]